MIEPRILITLGPASLNEGFVTRSTELGVYLFRINLSHTPLEAVEETIEKIQSWTDIPVCLDSEGAQIRNQGMEGGEIYYDAGDTVRMYDHAVAGNKGQISFTPLNIVSHFEPGDRIRIDFDGAEFEITERQDGYVSATTICGGRVGSSKAADVNRTLPLEPLTSKDFAAIELGRKKGIKNFALSFANRREDVQNMRAASGEDANIICKIESRDGVRNLPEILLEADEILLDRGDLSRQIELHKIPVFQRRIITSANKAGKPVYVATNLLESMTHSSSPTRAEVNDVVSTLLMGADGLVLAAETAIGNHPDEAVKMIRLLIDEVGNWNPDASLEDLLRS